MRRTASAPRMHNVAPKGFSMPGLESSNIKPVEMCQGFSVWKNERNGFLVMRTHYTADPAKRSEEWIDQIAAKMGGRNSPDFRKFMGIDFSVRKGLPVFGPETFVNVVGDPSVCHVISPSFPIPEWWSKRRGIDPGIVSAFAVSFWAKSPHGIHFLYDELYVKNAYQVTAELPSGTRLTGLDAMKYFIVKKSRNGCFESTIIDPASRQRQLASGFGAESPRANLLEQMLADPYPIPCEPSKRSGAETLDIQRFRNLIFNKQFYPVLNDEERAILGVDYNPAGYHLFGGYFFESCQAHRNEFENLKWEEAVDPNVNPAERIQDYDNHSWDASKYALSEEWDQSKRGKPDVTKVADHKTWRQQQCRRDFVKHSKALHDQQQLELGEQSWLQQE